MFLKRPQLSTVSRSSSCNLATLIKENTKILKDPLSAGASDPEPHEEKLSNIENFTKTLATPTTTMN